MLQCLIMLRVRERAVFVDLSHQRLNNVSCYPHWFWINFSQSYNFSRVYKSQAGESPLALGKAFIFYIPRLSCTWMSSSLSHLKAKCFISHSTLQILRNYRSSGNPHFNLLIIVLNGCTVCTDWGYYRQATLEENTFVTVYLKMCIHVLNKLSYLRSPNIVLDIVHLLTIKEKVWPGGGGARH